MEKVERVRGRSEGKVGCAWGGAGEREDWSKGYVGGGRKEEGEGKSRTRREGKGRRKEKRKTAMGTEKERRPSTGFPTRSHTLCLLTDLGSGVCLFA